MSTARAAARSPARSGSRSGTGTARQSSTLRNAGAASLRSTGRSGTAGSSTGRSGAGGVRNSGPPGSAKGGKAGDDKKGGKGKGKKKFKLIEDPVGINKLLHAAAHDDAQTIRDMLELKERERKVDIKGPTGGEALARAALFNHRNAVAALTQFGVRPEADEARAFHIAAAQGNLPLVDQLLTREVEQKAIDESERLKLLAKKKKRVRRRKKKPVVITPLVNVPANTTELTALHHSAMIGHLRTVAHLIAHGANVNAQTHGDNMGMYNGWTPLHFAADNGHLGVVRYLYQHGAALELPTHEGESAMVLAAESGRFEVVKWLLAQGVDPRTPRRGMEAAQWALYRGASDAVEYVVGYGGLPELNAKQVWFPPRFTLKDVLVNELSEALCRKLDTAVYKGEVKYRERLYRREAVDSIRWIVDVYNPRELDPDKAVATAIEQLPRSVVHIIWLFDSETIPW